MRKEFAKVLRDQFTKKVAEQLADFEPYKEKTIYLFPGERAFYRVVNDALWLFIVCSPDSRGHEAFTIELGWSTQQRFPENGMRLNCTPSDSGEEFSLPEAMLRLNSLGAAPEWWTVEEIADPFDTSAAGLEKMARKVSAAEARELVLPILDEAFAALLSLGMPYLEQRIAWSGR